MAKTVTMIPATINPHTRLPKFSVQKRRACGYARVSTDKDEQFTSYEAQVDYYTRYIKSKPELEFVKVYTDEGISATNTKHRDGFNEMIKDALDGKIDLIVTKSVSRFARNTVDSLVTIRKLKEKGVEVYFEKENIWTLDSKGELLLTIMSSLAQEESRSISENVTWGQRKRIADGKVSLGYKSFLGYDKGPDGIPVVNKEQAEIVKRIYRDYMHGKTPWTIAQELTNEEVPTPTGRGKKWAVSTIDSILSNEKYKGAALLQKKFTVDYLTKKMKVNEGEIPQYYVEDSHEVIIQPEEWERVQKEIARRKEYKRRYSGNSFFAAKLVCGDCGAFYGSKVWNSTDKYRKTIWQCNDKFKGDDKCTTPHVTETEIKTRFVQAFNMIFNIRKEIIQNCELIIETLTDCSDINIERTKIEQELKVIADLVNNSVKANASKPQDQNEYQKRYNGYVEKYESLTEKLQNLQEQELVRKGRKDLFNDFLNILKKQKNPIQEFDKDLWVATVDRVKIMPDKTMVFIFRDNSEVRV